MRVNAPPETFGQFRLEFAELPSVTLVGLRVQVNVFGEIVTDNEIVPVNPLILFTVMMWLKVPPAGTERPPTPYRAKSDTFRETVVETVLVPLVPIMVIVYDPVAAEPADTDRVDVADPPVDSVTLVGLRETVGPEGETVAVKFTTPENPVPAVTVIVTVPLDWTGRFRLDGLGLRL